MPSSAAEPRLQRAVWTLLVALLAPIALAWLAWRAWRQTGAGDATGERLGRVAPRADRPLWFHAASVGEVNALLIVLRALDARQPGLPVHVTTFTATGARRAREALAGRPDTRVSAVPLDLPWTARAFLGAVAPRALVVVESEVWPNLLIESARAGVPRAFVSARLTARAADRLAWFGALVAHALADAVVGAQGEADAQRWRALGAGEARVTGNVKWDLVLDATLPGRGASLRHDLLGDRPVLVAGSTREGEESAVIDAFVALRRAVPRLALVVAPRHPERAAAAVAAAEAAGLGSVRRTSGAPLGAADVLVVDGLGELLAFYAAADVAFVGGSLAPFGGHNLLEPAALGVPTLAGPHQDNAPDIAARLVEAGGARLVADARALADEAGRLFADENARGAMGARARAAVAANRGAVDRCLALITPFAAR